MRIVSSDEATETPIYLCNRDRLTTTKGMVDWLISTGSKKVVIVDNASTYPPLLSYYKELPSGVSVHSMGRNAGPYDSRDWAALQQDTPFVFSDSDLNLITCPKDLVAKCLSFLYEFPNCGRVGPNLRLDNIPKENANAILMGNKTLLEWEGDSWKNLVTHEGVSFYNAPIDTTFAIYPAHYTRKLLPNVTVCGVSFPHDCAWTNIRLDFPYVAEHAPWYSLKPYSEEESYYREHVGSGDYGGGVGVQPWSHLDGVKGVDRDGRGPTIKRSFGPYRYDKSGCKTDWWDRHAR